MPRAGLIRDRVVEEAAAMADEVGLSNLTLVALAARLGVRQPSLYKHITSMADLHRGIGLRAKADLGELLARASVGKSRGDAVHAMSRAYRAWAIEHPAQYEVAQLPPTDGDAEQWAASWQVMNVIGDVLGAYGLEGDDSIDAIRAFRAVLHGFVSLEALGSFQLAADLERSFTRLIGGLDDFLTHISDRAGDPTSRPED